MMRQQPPSPRPGRSLSRTLFVVILISSSLFIIYKYFSHSGDSFSSVPEEMQINYVPADFDYTLDEDRVLAILAHPMRYRREFNELVYDFNMSILKHVSTRMGLPDTLMSRVAEEYQKHHPYLRQMYFNDFVALKDTSSNMYQAWYENESVNASEVLKEVASKYTCFLVNHVLMTLLESGGGKLNVKGSKVDTPCGIALTEALNPMMERLQARAAVVDFSKSRGMMKERVENMIAEMATMEVRDKKGLNKQLQTKIWGYTVSSTDIEVSAISIIKIGFKLDKYFDIKLSEKQKTLTVTLPHPEILSHEVYPRVDKLDIGWMREVKKGDFNKNFNLLRSEFRREAQEGEMYEKAKKQATELMRMMLEPVTLSFDKKYALKVEFQGKTPGDTLEDTFLKDYIESENTGNPGLEENAPL